MAKFILVHNDKDNSFQVAWQDSYEDEQLGLWFAETSIPPITNRGIALQVVAALNLKADHDYNT